MINTELQMDTWNIKMTRPMTLWGMITPRIESIVTHYSIMIDKARTMASKKEVEREFMLTMLSHGIWCD
nr:MAG TPA: hypothetical protein [Caudoviricetes sp.]